MPSPPKSNKLPVIAGCFAYKMAGLGNPRLVGQHVIDESIYRLAQKEHTALE